MMRKSEYALWTLLVLAVLAAGSTMVGLARSQTASAANSEIYRQLDLFGEVLERVRADYVEKPEDSALVESAIKRPLAEALLFGDLKEGSKVTVDRAGDELALAYA